MQIQIYSEMARIFPEKAEKRYSEITELYAFADESAVFQIAYRKLDLQQDGFRSFTVRVRFPSPFQMYRVRLVPVINTGRVQNDGGYLQNKSNLYPDLLDPIDENTICDASNDWQSLAFICEHLPAGEHEAVVEFFSWPDRLPLTHMRLPIHVCEMKLPKSSLIYTRWFHADALASYYGVPVFSEQHWQIMENFLQKATQRGMTAVLTPIHTPPLDTDISRERPTVQLVDITVLEEEQYAFSFEKLDRWVQMCRGVGIEYFEMAHLFSQWGAKSAPKIVARTADGAEKTIFDWNTSANSREYFEFLDAYLPALDEHLCKLGIQNQTFFHISDEPSREALSHYRLLNRKVRSLLPDYPIIDAISDIDFYTDGACDIPIPSVDRIEPFHEQNVPSLWTYYCCGQRYKVPNSFITMPGERIRALGILLYAYQCAGFLQWGYNFYFGRNARYPLNPYRTTDGDNTWPAGDPFIVYPSSDGKALDSIRHLTMQKALEDLRALQLCEEKLGRENTMDILTQNLRGRLSFTHYPSDERFYYYLRKKIYEALKEE